jgi:hypothetical protein
MIETTRPGGRILDLQVIRPNPVIELDGRAISHIDGEPLFLWADAALAAIDTRIAAGDLTEEAVDDHDVRKHYSDGTELVEDIADSKRSLPDDDVSMLASLQQPLVVREHCRTRLLHVVEHDRQH